jgi:hypothetical protein
VNNQHTTRRDLSAQHPKKKTTAGGEDSKVEQKANAIAEFKRKEPRGSALRPQQQW